MCENNLTYDELVQLMIIVEHDTQFFRDRLVFASIGYRSDAEQCQKRILDNNRLYNRLKELAIEQLDLGGRGSDSSPV